MSGDDERDQWRSVPPTDDDLTSIGVSVRRAVLSRARDGQRTSSRRRRLRFTGRVGSVVALVALGATSGGVALGLIPSPFEGTPQAAPTATVSAPPEQAPTATPTPSVSPVAPAPDTGPPAAALPLSCDELASASALTSLLRAPESYGGLGPFMPSEAGVLQAGGTTCRWGSSSGSASASLQLTVSPDVETGRAWVTQERAGGAADDGLGDLSAVSCSTEYALCDGSVVVGDFWIEYHYEESPGLTAAARALLADHVGRVVDVVRPLEAGPGWVAPAASARWAPAGACATLGTATPMSTLLSSPEVVDTAIDVLPGTRNGIEQTQDGSWECRWTVPEGVGTPEGVLASMDVEIAPGAGWAWEQAPGTFGDTSDSAQHVAVTGAQDAVQRCSTAEGDSCWLDVLVDDSWMQVGYGNAVPPDQAGVLAAVAESVIAAR
ncbi:hypothetical protein ES689_14775 [Frigoribacterium sp. ACAM 257]|uniref:hypothetical protein n=1 Tax=Frigoribacterium sp. ACAM 257 TaxID=2508998 RepID=UPI0011B98DB3|nr:hypothetical protein [Frigoribacterium sp. ACAM 257]TWX34574.1 hypothetical protein ES689_14775 [Frigoribacterium sp. ACAM 257]